MEVVNYTQLSRKHQSSQTLKLNMSKSDRLSGDTQMNLQETRICTRRAQQVARRAPRSFGLDSLQLGHFLLQFQELGNFVFLEGQGSGFKELFHQAANDGWMKTVLITQIGYRHLLSKVLFQNDHFLFRGVMLWYRLQVFLWA